MNASLHDPDALQSQMELVRSNLQTEFRDLVQNARTATDWRYYWRRYPAACCGAAAILGFILLPSRRADAGARVERLTRANEKFLGSLPREKSLTRQLFGMALGLAAQGGLRILARHLEQAISKEPSRPVAAPLPEGEMAGPR